MLRHHVGKVEFDARNLDAVRREIVLRFLERSERSSALDGMQPTFRQVPPSVAALLDAGRLQAELGRADRGDVPAGAAADDDDVVGFSGIFLLRLRGQAAAGHASRSRSMALQNARGNVQTGSNPRKWLNPPTSTVLEAHESHTRVAMVYMGTGDGLTPL